MFPEERAGEGTFAMCGREKGDNGPLGLESSICPANVEADRSVLNNLLVGKPLVVGKRMPTFARPLAGLLVILTPHRR